MDLNCVESAVKLQSLDQTLTHRGQWCSFLEPPCLSYCRARSPAIYGSHIVVVVVVVIYPLTVPSVASFHLHSVLACAVRGSKEVIFQPLATFFISFWVCLTGGRGIGRGIVEDLMKSRVTVRETYGSREIALVDLEYWCLSDIFVVCPTWY